MRIAIILDNIHRAGTDSKIKEIMLFETDEDLVVAVGEDIISIFNMDYLCLWLLAKQVVRLYCDGLTDAEKAFLVKTGIETYPLARIRDHPILQALLLKDENGNS